MKNFFASLLFLSQLSVVSYAQQAIDTAEVPVWIDMMQDPKANFFETQKAFELYWENRTIEKGSGWKPFKRWESFMESRVDAAGNKPAPAHNLNEYTQSHSLNAKGYSPQGHGSWKELGPVFMPSNGTSQPNGLGRLNCIAFHPLQPNTWYVGAPSGGFWRTFNAGQTWETTTDSLPTLGVSSLIVNKDNSSVIYMGTGDRDGSDAPGIGVMKSYNGGDTWELINTGMGNRVVGKMVMHPNDTNMILAATSGGIYKTIDGGANWSRKSISGKHFKDIVMNPTDPSVVYATENGNFYRSINTGDTWTLITSGFGSNISRMVIGVSIDDPSSVYVVGVDNRVYEGTYLSTDSGKTFTLRSNTPNIMDYSVNGSGTSGQGWYNLCIAVDPTDINVVYVGGVNIFKSTDGGLSWLINAHWTGSGGAPAIHADQHELVYSSVDGKLYSGNDGGIYSTSNGGSTWIEHSSGLGIAQVYKIGQSPLSLKLSINGYQDNGTAIYNGNWRTEIGGDGMECISDYSDTNYLYGALYYGDIRRSSNNGINFNRIARDGTNGITESGAWVTPYILDFTDPNTMYVGYRNLWRSTNVKASSTSAVSWLKLTNSLAGSNSATLRVLEQSPANTDILYMSRSDNKLFRTDNLSSASPAFTNLTSSLPTSTWPRDIEAHPNNVNRVWMVQSNSVFYSSNKGASWNDISSNLPNVSVNCIVYDESSSGDLYVGTDLGVYFLKDGETDWIEYNAGLPISVEVSELEIYYAAERLGSRLKASTYGRGLWESELFNEPEADFKALTTSLCVNDEAQFKDLSKGTYNQLTWKFQGGIPNTSNQRNPKVIYPTAGLFDVSLIISNDLQTDTIVKVGYIHVTKNQVSVTPDTSYIQLGQSVTLTASGASNYLWFPSFGLSSTTDSIVIATPSSTTKYFVFGDNGGSCDTAQALVNVSPVGIDANKKRSLSVFPNPTSDQLTLLNSEVFNGLIAVYLTDITGKSIIDRKFILNNEKSLELSLKELDKGIYFLRINSNSLISTFRIVKE